MKKKKVKKLIIKNIKLFILASAVVMVWRGIWNFLDHYIFPTEFVISNLLTIAVGLAIMLLVDFDFELNELK